MAEQKIVMTQEGMNKLNEEYRHLIDVERPEVVEQLVQARSQGDLSENADYKASRDRLAQIESRIAELEHIRDLAEVIEGDEVSGKKINLGYIVTYKNEEGEILKVRIVGTIEADPFSEPPSVSDQSALGNALIGKSAGQKVIVECEEPYEIEILKAEIWKNK